jgi:hypothetical protein
MLKKMLPLVVLMLLAIAPFNCAGAAEQAAGCRLKGGSVVQLAAEACALEGGTPNTATAPVAASAVRAVAPADANASLVQPAGEPRLAAAQRAIADLLNKTVVMKGSKKTNLESIERVTRFDGCGLRVDETMQVDHGNAISMRLNFQISSKVDFRNVSRDAFGVLGRISSKGGVLKGFAVYFEERKRKDGNNIAISVLEEGDEGFRKYAVPDLIAFWDAPRDDFWMVDVYGYPKDNGFGSIATDRIRILFIMNTEDDAAALKKALDDVQALCKS